MSLETLEAIRSRRAIRYFTREPIDEKLLWKILEAARWAPTASNRRVHRFICLTEQQIIEQIRMVSPGMGGNPTVLIVICIDWNLAAYVAGDRTYRTAYIDVGTAAENMLLAAHSMGLGAWPMTSFSPRGVQILLNLPAGLKAEMFIGLGYPSEPPLLPKRPNQRILVEDLVQWGPYPDTQVK